MFQPVNVVVTGMDVRFVQQSMEQRHGCVYPVNDQFTKRAAQTGQGRGAVTLAQLVSSDLHGEDKVRCAVCCDQAEEIPDRTGQMARVTDTRSPFSHWDSTM